VFAWQVLVLGHDPIDLNGKASREIVVADRCLKPVSQIEPEQVNALAMARAHLDLDEALADIGRYLERHPMTPEAFEARVEAAAEQAHFQHVLEAVPLAVALKAIDFRPTSSDEHCVWRWSGMYKGVELLVVAAPEMFGGWTIVGKCVTARVRMWDERVVIGDQPRGKVASLVLDLWRTAFGREAAVPTSLNIALCYEQHQKDIRRVKIGLPTLYVDGEVLRSTRRWLAQRHGLRDGAYGPLPDCPVALSFSDGLLRFEVAGEACGCPAQGVWVEDCRISLREFLAMPYWKLRGWRVQLERSLDAILFGGHGLAVNVPK
jgi:hypothetical protein